MKTKIRYYKRLMLLVLFAGSVGAWAQTSTSLTQTVCVGSQPYLVDNHVGSSYAWTVSGGGSITSGQGSNSILIDWTIPGGPYTVQVIETADACPAPPVSVAVTVVSQPVGPTLQTMTPASPVCVGTDVSATFLAGSGGFGCSDAFQYRFDGVGVWTAYTPGANLASIGHTLVEIQGQRSGCTSGAGCSGTPWVTLASWTVNPNNTIALTSAVNTDAQTVCLNTPIVNITYATTGATGATFSGLPAGVTGSWAANVVTITGSPSTTIGSPFTYTVDLTGGCGTVSTTGTITVTPNNTIALTSAVNTDAQTVCLNTPIVNITYATTGATGATFSGLPAGVTGSWAANVVTITGSPSTTIGSPFTYTVDLTGGCGTVSTTGTITVTPNNTIALTSAVNTDAQTVCLNTPIVNITYATTGATGA